MFVYHLIDDDKELEKIRHDCLDGSLRCGDCKAKASELMVEMFDEIHDRQDEAREIANISCFNFFSCSFTVLI